MLGEKTSKVGHGPFSAFSLQTSDFQDCVVKIKHRRLTVPTIIHLRTPASDACFLKVIVGGRRILWNFDTMGCTHGCYWTRLQRLGQSYTLCSFALLSGLSLRQTGLWLKKEKSILKTSVSELVELSRSVKLFKKSGSGEKTSKVSHGPFSAFSL